MWVEVLHGLRACPASGTRRLSSMAAKFWGQRVRPRTPHLTSFSPCVAIAANCTHMLPPSCGVHGTRAAHAHRAPSTLPSSRPRRKASTCASSTRPTSAAAASRTRSRSTRSSTARATCGTSCCPTCAMTCCTVRACRATPGTCGRRGRCPVVARHGMHGRPRLSNAGGLPPRRQSPMHADKQRVCRACLWPLACMRLHAAAYTRPGAPPPPHTAGSCS